MVVAKAKRFEIRNFDSIQINYSICAVLRATTNFGIQINNSLTKSRPKLRETFSAKLDFETAAARGAMILVRTNGS